MQTTIRRCARCGGVHVGIELRRFTLSLQGANPDNVTHFAMCPATDEPILVSVKQDTETIPEAQIDAR